MAIEATGGLVVACLRATGWKVYAINPRCAARCRDRTGVSRRKSDHAGAVMLASILRTGQELHRLLPEGSELAQAIIVLARAQQDAVGGRGQARNKLRSLLRGSYPAFLAAFRAREGLPGKVARTVLAPAPAPAPAARVSKPRLVALLPRRAGNAASTPRLNASSRSSAASSRVSCQRPRRRWAAGRWLCPANPAPPARPPATWLRPPSKRSAATLAPPS